MELVKGSFKRTGLMYVSLFSFLFCAHGHKPMTELPCKVWAPLSRTTLHSLCCPGPFWHEEELGDQSGPLTLPSKGPIKAALLVMLLANSDITIETST